MHKDTKIAPQVVILSSNPRQGKTLVK